MCCRYSLELRRLVEAFLMSTNNILVCFIKQVEAIQMGTNNICFYEASWTTYTSMKKYIHDL